MRVYEYDIWVYTMNNIFEVFRRDSGCIKLHWYYKRLSAAQSRTVVFVVAAISLYGIVVIGIHCVKVAAHRLW